MNDFAALWFLEWRQIANRIKAILRSRSRTIFYVLLVVYFAAMSILRARRYHQAITLSEPFASAAFFAFITLLAVVAYGAASGLGGAFASNADARFLIGSKLDERFVVFWLQARRSAATMMRMFVSILFYALLVARSSNSFGIAFAILGGTATVTAVSVPMAKLRNIIGARLAKASAGAAAAIAMLPMLIVLSGYLKPSPTAAGVERLGGGRFINALFANDARALLTLWGTCALLLWLGWIGGKDLYPDLYTSSLRAFAFRMRARGGASAAFRAQPTYKNRAPSGALYRLFEGLRGSWAIVWKEWIGFSRSDGMQRVFIFGLLASATAGWFLGTLALRSKNPLEESAGLAVAFFYGFIIFIAMGSALSLGTDLGKPLWWIGPDSLRARLTAWICAASWRTAAVVYAGIIAWALTLRMPVWAIYAAPIAIATVSYLRAVGLMIYAIFPSTIDQRGPMGIVRAMITYVLSFPPIIAAVLSGYLLRGVPVLQIGLATALGVTMAGAEIYLLVMFAAARIAGSGAAFARAEAT